jgi:hypothetical protein
MFSYLNRWKHVASCHKSSTITWEQDIYYDDDVLHQLKKYEASAGNEDVESEDE